MNDSINADIKQNGRYLLFLDILGFKEMVAKRSAAEVFGVIDDALKSFLNWEHLNGEFKTIYFSDTFLFYQEHKGYGAWAFLDIYAVAGMLLSALLAKGIPARGTISFGEFEVQIDSSNRHQIYSGKAFIEAYEAEQKENWVGVTILPSAWQIWNDERELMKAFESEGVWMCRHDKVLLLMPLIKLRSCYWSSLSGEVEDSDLAGGSVALNNDIRAFDFLRKTARAFRSEGDFSSKLATKYHATMLFLADVMKDDFFMWVNMICDKELGALNNHLSASPSGER
ncbi:MAG: hypothetical protein IPK22_25975 [Verrucomicrobiaceae bacterium]|nr:hypothetical protein [Verrucomicrobiaceae bacterium]